MSSSYENITPSSDSRSNIKYLFAIIAIIDGLADFGTTLWGCMAIATGDNIQNSFPIQWIISMAVSCIVFFIIYQTFDLWKKGFLAIILWSLAILFDLYTSFRGILETFISTRNYSDEQLVVVGLITLFFSTSPALIKKIVNDSF